VADSNRPPARLRRSYFDCRFGQLHVHQAIPAGGGFDEATALVCLPGAAGLGGFFQPLLGPLGADRSIYAPDLPGHGQSDPAGMGLAPVPAAVAAVLDLLDSLRERRVGLLAQAEGVAVATALLAERPGLVLCLALSGQGTPGVPPGVPAGLPVRAFALAETGAEHISEAVVRAQFTGLAAFLGSAHG
jgi:pimeloyl-ACP methyl ester carboxylesterase